MGFGWRGTSGSISPICLRLATRQWLVGLNGSVAPQGPLHRPRAGQAAGQVNGQAPLLCSGPTAPLGARAPFFLPLAGKTQSTPHAGGSHCRGRRPGDRRAAGGGGARGDAAGLGDGTGQRRRAGPALNTRPSTCAACDATHAGGGNHSDGKLLSPAGQDISLALARSQPGSRRMIAAAWS